MNCTQKQEEAQEEFNVGDLVAIKGLPGNYKLLIHEFHPWFCTCIQVNQTSKCYEYFKVRTDFLKLLDKSKSSFDTANHSGHKESYSKELREETSNLNTLKWYRIVRDLLKCIFPRPYYKGYAVVFLPSSDDVILYKRTLDKIEQLIKEGCQVQVL